MSLSSANRKLKIEDIEFFYSALFEYSNKRENILAETIQRTKASYLHYLQHTLTPNEFLAKWTPALKRTLKQRILMIEHDKILSDKLDPQIITSIIEDIEGDGFLIKSLFSDSKNEIEPTFFIDALREKECASAPSTPPLVPKQNHSITGISLFEKKLNREPAYSLSLLKLEADELFNQNDWPKMVVTLRDSITFTESKSQLTPMDHINLANAHRNLAGALHASALALMRKKEYINAIELLKNGISECHQIDPEYASLPTSPVLDLLQRDLSQFIYRYGIELYNEKKFQDAYQVSSLALAELNKVSDESQVNLDYLSHHYRYQQLLAYSSNQYGIHLFEKGLFDLALVQVKDSIKEYNKIDARFHNNKYETTLANFHFDLAIIFYEKANNYFAQNEFHKSAKYAENALDVCKKNKNISPEKSIEIVTNSHIIKGKAFNQLGLECFNLAFFEEAANFFNAAFNEFRKVTSISSIYSEHQTIPSFVKFSKEANINTRLQIENVEFISKAAAEGNLGAIEILALNHFKKNNLGKAILLIACVAAYKYLDKDHYIELLKNTPNSRWFLDKNNSKLFLVDCLLDKFSPINFEKLIQDYRILDPILLIFFALDKATSFRMDSVFLDKTKKSIEASFTSLLYDAGYSDAEIEATFQKIKNQVIELNSQTLTYQLPAA